MVASIIPLSTVPSNDFGADSKSQLTKVRSRTENTWMFVGEMMPLLRSTRHIALDELAAKKKVMSWWRYLPLCVSGALRKESILRSNAVAYCVSVGCTAAVVAACAIANTWWCRFFNCEMVWPPQQTASILSSPLTRVSDCDSKDLHSAMKYCPTTFLTHNELRTRGGEPYHPYGGQLLSGYLTPCCTRSSFTHVQSKPEAAINRNPALPLCMLAHMI